MTGIGLSSMERERVAIRLSIYTEDNRVEKFLKILPWKKRSIS